MSAISAFTIIFTNEIDVLNTTGIISVSYTHLFKIRYIAYNFNPMASFT